MSPNSSILRKDILRQELCVANRLPAKAANRLKLCQQARRIYGQII
jgi:hypothetical protein